MESPHARVIRPKPQRCPTKGVHRNRVLHYGILQIILFRIIVHVKPSLPVPKNPKVVPVKVPRMRLAVVFGHGVGILKYKIHRCVELQPINAVARSAIRVWGHIENVVVGKFMAVRGRSGVKCVGYVLFEGDEIRGVRESERDIVDRPVSVFAYVVLCVEEYYDSIRGCGGLVNVPLACLDGEALCQPWLSVVPCRRGRWNRRRGPFWVVGVVVENAQPWWGGSVSAYHV